MKAEILAIGTELLLGQITNSNAAYLSEQLNACGIPVYFHTVVGDNPRRLENQLQISASRSDLLVFSGGLGPTQDDLTKEVVAQFVNHSLVLDEESMAHIRRFFEQRRAPMSENNRKQAMVVEGCTVFPNENGLAPGMAIRTEQHHFLLFPGPPGELKPMFEKYAIPYLQQFMPDHSVVHSKVMRFAGIGESMLENQLQDLISEQTSPTIAPLAKEGEVTLRLTSYASSSKVAEQEMEHVIDQIQERLGEYHYGWDDDSLESVLVQLLQTGNLSLAVAESCTGGLLSQHITRIPGVSQVFKGGTVCYTTGSKEQLGIDPELIAQEGVISEACAEALARHIQKVYAADVGISVTGVAGPARQEGKPIGLVYIGLSIMDRTEVQALQLGGSREAIRLRATKMALFYTLKRLREFSST